MIKKDIQNQIGFRLILFYILWGSILEIIIYYFTNKFVDHQSFVNLTHGISYFSYVVIGYAYADIFTSGTTASFDIIAQERTQGTFESYLLSRHSLYKLLFAGSFPEILRSIIRTTIFILIGLIMGFNLKIAGSAFSVIIFFSLSVLFFISASMIFSAFMLIDGRFRHLAGLYISVSTVFSGAFYPVEYLPDWLLNISKLFPFGFAMTGIRDLISGHASSPKLIFYMSFYLLLSLTISLLAFKALDHYSRKRGSILKY